jgi:hypothetical protein
MANSIPLVLYISPICHPATNSRGLGAQSGLVVCPGRLTVGALVLPRSLQIPLSLCARRMPTGLDQSPTLSASVALCKPSVPLSRDSLQPAFGIAGFCSAGTPAPHATMYLPFIVGICPLAPFLCAGLEFLRSGPGALSRDHDVPKDWGAKAIPLQLLSVSFSVRCRQQDAYDNCLLRMAQSLVRSKAWNCFRSVTNPRAGRPRSCRCSSPLIPTPLPPFRLPPNCFLPTFPFISFFLLFLFTDRRNRPILSYTIRRPLEIPLVAEGRGVIGLPLAWVGASPALIIAELQNCHSTRQALAGNEADLCITDSRESL